MKVFATRIITDTGVKLMEAAGLEVNEWTEKRELTRAELIHYCHAHDALIVAGPIKIDRELLQECKHLKVVVAHGVGFDHINVQAATELGIPVGNTPDVVTRATAETAFMLMMMVSRKAIHSHKRILRGEWKFFEPTQNLGVELFGKTLGIFGLGSIGFQFAKLCRAFYNMKVIYCNRHTNQQAEDELGAEKVSFDELLRLSDVVSVHAPLSAETREVFDRNAFEKMKVSSIFINTARGGLHNESDLIEGLKTGLIWGAGLDVTNPEPMLPDSPLLNMERAVVLPHIGTSTEETRIAMSERIAQNIIAGVIGERLPFIVNPEVYG